MDRKKTRNGGEIEINMVRILGRLIDRVWVLGAAALVCAILMVTGTFLFVKPQYQSSAKFYVNNGSISMGGASISMSSGDLAASRNLVDSYIVILETRETLNDVIDYAGVDLSNTELLRMLSAKAVNNTEIFQVTVTSADPQEAEKLANAIGHILPKRITAIIEGTSAKVVEAAVVPVTPCSPSYAKNAVFGYLLGFALAVAVIALKEITDITIREEADVLRTCPHPVLASIPDMQAPGKGGGGYAASREAGKPAPAGDALLGGDISFAAAEAYKLLRTKLQFSFAGEEGSRVVGVSSALCGEGKSLTSVNLAYALAELGKQVVLIDCDMRRPTLGEKLKIQKIPGMSSYLTGQSDLMSLVQSCGLSPEGKGFHVICAGQEPPNPNELLSSPRMGEALRRLRQCYDYVILDLPPVHEVSDAMAVARETDGTLLVVRENYCDRPALADTVRQFEYIQAKILGIVINCARERTGKYGKGYYQKYGGTGGKGRQ